MAERFNIHSQLEYLQMKYTGNILYFLTRTQKKNTNLSAFCCGDRILTAFSLWLGTGHPDITRYEWVVNHHRDSAASYIGHSHLSMLFGVVENESQARIRYNLLQKMVAPCGKEPATEKEDSEMEEEDMDVEKKEEKKE